MSNNLKKVGVAVALGATAALGGCASVHGEVNSPVTDRAQARNVFFDNATRDACIADVAACAARVPVGTPVAEAFNLLGVNPGAVRVLSRQDTNVILYGQANLNIPYGQREEALAQMERQQGFSVSYNNIRTRRSFGITSSRTREEGMTHTFNLVFEGGLLKAPVSYTSTPIDQTRTKGYFSDLPNIINIFR